MKRNEQDEQNNASSSMKEEELFSAQRSAINIIAVCEQLKLPGLKSILKGIRALPV